MTWWLSSEKIYLNMILQNLKIKPSNSDLVSWISYNKVYLEVTVNMAPKLQVETSGLNTFSQLISCEIIIDSICPESFKSYIKKIRNYKLLSLFQVHYFDTTGFLYCTFWCSSLCLMLRYPWREQCKVK